VPKIGKVNTMVQIKAPAAQSSLLDEKGINYVELLSGWTDVDKLNVGVKLDTQMPTWHWKIVQTKVVDL